MRYLPKFKWHQLKEGTIYNQQARKSRLEQKLSQARRENEFFLENREQKRRQQKMAERRAAKAAKNGTSEAPAPEASKTKDSRFPVASLRKNAPPSRPGSN